MPKKQTKKGDNHELTDIDTQFVSLVTAGANRQSNFMVVKTDKPDEEKNKQDVEPSDSDTTKDDADNSDSTDMSDWLESTGTAVDTAMLDAEFEQTLADVEEEDKPDTSSKDAGEEIVEPPAVEKAQKTDEEITKALAKAEKAEAEAVELRKELQTEKLKVAKVRQSSIGGSSALLTGEVGSAVKGDKQDVTENRVEWASGQDLTSSTE
jgi:hypothetical protein